MPRLLQLLHRAIDRRFSQVGLSRGTGSGAPSLCGQRPADGGRYLGVSAGVSVCYRLEKSPDITLHFAANLAGMSPAGFEPTAPGLGILCSIRLSYGDVRPL